MDLSELPAYLDSEFSYPVELETVIERAGGIRIEGPDPADSESIGSILGPLGTDTFESSAVLYETIYGNVSDDHIGRKYYDDRGGTQPDVPAAPMDDENVSF